VPTINFVREGKKVQVEVGESLRYAALDNDIPLYQKFLGMSNFIQCHGNGLCGTDEVIVSPANAVNPPTWQEKLNENIPPFGPLRQKRRGTRLACQVQVNGDIDVITGVGFMSPTPEKLLNESRGRR
jgi:ferredoxin